MNAFLLMPYTQAVKDGVKPLGNGNPLQCSCLENPRDREAWWAAVYGVTQSWTRLKQLITSWEIDGETVETVSDFDFWAPKSLQMVTAAMKLKDAYSLEGKL